MLEELKNPEKYFPGFRSKREIQFIVIIKARKLNYLDYCFTNEAVL